MDGRTLKSRSVRVCPGGGTNLKIQVCPGDGTNLIYIELPYGRTPALGGEAAKATAAPPPRITGCTREEKKGKND